MSSHPFDGLKVVDASTVIAGPAAAMILADFGADVVKVERPGAGDMLRALDRVPTMPDAGFNYLWELDGRNKRSLTLDLETEAGMEVLRRLIAACDVFITNQPLPVRGKFRLRYEDLKDVNPRMIYASLTAYGEEGPERDRRGFDQLAYWARSGLMELMREPGTVPAQGLPGMGDHPTAMSIYAGIVTALIQRERTGEGGEVRTSLLANGLWSASAIAQGAMAGGDMARYRERNRVPPAMLRSYRARDGRWLQLNMVRDEALRRRLFAAMDATHLLDDERFATPETMYAHREALGDLIQEIVGTRTSAEWLDTFEAAQVPVNRVAEIEETVDDPQIRANGMAVRPEPGSGMESPYLVNHPLRLSNAPQVGPRRAPALGEHAEAILRELGYRADEIRAMKDDGVF